MSDAVVYGRSVASGYTHVGVCNGAVCSLTTFSQQRRRPCV